MPRSSEHQELICLAPEIRVGLYQKMAKDEISAKYSIQQYIIRGLYQDHYISKDVYEYYMMEYSRKLRSDRQLRAEKLTPQQQEQQQKQDELTRRFRMVADQWHIDHKTMVYQGKMMSWREYWLIKAQEHSENEGAQELLNKYVRQKQQ